MFFRAQEPIFNISQTHSFPRGGVGVGLADIAKLQSGEVARGGGFLDKDVDGIGIKVAKIVMIGG